MTGKIIKTMKSKPVYLPLLTLILAGLLYISAPDQNRAQSVKSTDLYIRNAALLQGQSGPNTANTKVKKVVNIRIQNGKIRSFSPVTAKSPRGVPVLDAKGRPVTPGLVEINSSAGLVDIWMIDKIRDNQGGRGDKGYKDLIRASFSAHLAFNEDSDLFPVFRAHGVTSLLSVPVGGVISGQSLWADLIGPFHKSGATNTAEAPNAGFARVIRPGVALHLNLGLNSARAFGASRGLALSGLRELLQEAKTYKTRKSSGQNYDFSRLSIPRVSPADLETLARLPGGELPLVANVNRAADIKQAIRLAREFKLKLIVNGGAEAWKCADELKRAGIPVIVYPYENLPRSFDSLHARLDNATILDRAGVAVILSTMDAYSSKHKAQKLRLAAGFAVRSGLPYKSALAAITIRPARALGLGDLYGEIAPGKIANLVVWSADPFEIQSRARHVIIHGREVSPRNRHRELLERYR